jgi:RNA polymerase sigma-70 factor (ECF subfamily)
MDQPQQTDEDSGINSLVAQAINGNEDALAALFSHYKTQLRGMIAFRMNKNLRGRVDPSDILQEAFVDLAKRLPEFEQKGMSFFVWLRLVAKERLLKAHRKHITAKKRDVRREVDHRDIAASATSVLLADHLIDRYTSVAGKAIKAEQGELIRGVLEQLDENDREIIALRIFEGLTNGETAEVLGMSKQTSSKRFIAAIGRLRSEITDLPGFNF